MQSAFIEVVEPGACATRRCLDSLLPGGAGKILKSFHLDALPVCCHSTSSWLLNDGQQWLSMLNIVLSVLDYTGELGLNNG